MTRITEKELPLNIKEQRSRARKERLKEMMILGHGKYAAFRGILQYKEEGCEGVQLIQAPPILDNLLS